MQFLHSYHSTLNPVVERAANHVVGLGQVIVQEILILIQTLCCLITWLDFQKILPCLSRIHYLRRCHEIFYRDFNQMMIYDDG